MRRDAGRWLFGGFAVLWAATWWQPRWPAEQALHNSLTVVAVGLTAIAWRRGRLPVASLAAVLIFLSLHVVAARWIYSFVPYDQWSSAIAGVRLSDEFGWHRNHFDRLVHAAYGACAAVVLFRYLVDRRLRPVFAAFVAVEIVLSTSALYELFEWGVAMALAPAAAEAYNGQQGDSWDAHRDMALAVAAAAVAAAGSLTAHRRRSLQSRGGPARPGSPASRPGLPAPRPGSPAPRPGSPAGNG